MPARIVEGQLPYTGGTGIEIDANKVISLLLREENNLILVNDENEVYTDLQFAGGLTPNSDFAVGVTVGKVLQSDGRPQSGLVLNWKTTSGDYARWIYANDGKLYFDNGTGTWKQVYYASEVDTLLSQLDGKVEQYHTELQGEIDNLKAIGRFLSLWDCETGQPISFPLSTPYSYKTGDYFLVENVHSTTNYKPNGNSYTGTASTTVETEEVKVGDLYIYDGTVWLLQLNHAKTVSFANIAGQPSDNANLANALNSKADATDLNTKMFTLSSTSDLTNAQAAYDWYAAGKVAIIHYSSNYYYYKGIGTNSVYFAVNEYSALDNTDVTSLVQKTLTIALSGSTVTSISSWNMSMTGYNVLRTGKDYTTPYTPTYAGSPATKKYVDDHADFNIVTATSGATLTISDLTTGFTPSADFTVSAGTVKEGMQYVLRINSGATAYTMTLGTGITNPFNETLTLTASKTTTVVFFATSSSALEVFSVRTEA